VEARLEICRRVEARELTDDRQISSTCKSAYIKANRVVLVTVRRFEQDESKAAHVIFGENYGSAWRHVRS